MFRILQELCATKEIQNYLRFQSRHVLSFNLVAETVKSLLWFHSRQEYLKETIAISDALIKMMDLNSENQLIANDLGIMDFVIYSLSKESNDELVQRGLGILLTLLQENSDHAIQMASMISTKLNYNKMDIHPELNLYNGPNQITLKYYQILIRLGELIEGREDETLADLGRQSPKILGLFKERLLSVEVIFGNEIVKTYFDVPPHKLDLLTEYAKEKATSRVPLVAVRERQTIFFEKELPKITASMDFQETRRFGPGRLLFKARKFIYGTDLLLTLLINLIMIASWISPLDPNNTFPILPGWYIPVINIFGSLLVVSSTLTLIIGLLFQQTWFSTKTMVSFSFWIVAILAISVT